MTEKATTVLVQGLMNELSRGIDSRLDKRDRILVEYVVKIMVEWYDLDDSRPPVGPLSRSTELI